MRHGLIVLFAAACTLLAGCVVAPYPAYPAPGPSTYDRAWDAALGAAADAGIQVTSADRATNRITGVKGNAAVAIDLRPQADGSLQVVFNAPGATETNPTLKDRWLGAYNRRMGR